jgi:hypothetical protein
MSQEKDYSKTVIYIIYCVDDTINDFYVGSTTHFNHRESVHKSDCKTTTNKFYNFVMANGGWSNFKMSIIEHFPCKSIEEKLIRERHYFDILKPALNTLRPVVFHQEFIDEKKLYDKNYWIANHGKRTKQCREYFESHKDIIYAKRNAKRHEKKLEKQREKNEVNLMAMEDSNHIFI